MRYRTIHVDLTADAPGERRLDVARFLVLRFESQTLVDLHVTPPPTEMGVWQGGVAVHHTAEFVEIQRAVGETAKKRAQAMFTHVGGADPMMAWREAEGHSARLLASAADLVGVGGAETDIAAAPVAELVTPTGVPVLMLPPPRSPS